MRGLHERFLNWYHRLTDEAIIFAVAGALAIAMGLGFCFALLANIGFPYEMSAHQQLQVRDIVLAISGPVALTLGFFFVFEIKHFMVPSEGEETAKLIKETASRS
jgi:phosphotransferase system  glucose/maltose/N-acetylglucosamine-specific IIC component